MLRGLATVSFWAVDVAAAKAWYAELLGINPYFERPDSDRPEYVEFHLGDSQHGLGIIDPGTRETAPWPVREARSRTGTSTTWPRCSSGSRGWARWSTGRSCNGGDAGYVTASVVDPFNNILGPMSNPHHREFLGTTEQARLVLRVEGVLGPVTTTEPLGHYQ